MRDPKKPQGDLEAQWRHALVPAAIWAVLTAGATMGGLLEPDPPAVVRRQPTVPMPAASDAARIATQVQRDAAARW